MRRRMLAGASWPLRDASVLAECAPGRQAHRYSRLIDHCVGRFGALIDKVRGLRSHDLHSDDIDLQDAIVAEFADLD